MERRIFHRAGDLLFGRMRLGLGFREGIGERRSGPMALSGSSSVSNKLASSLSTASLSEAKVDAQAAALATNWIVFCITESTVSSS